MGRNRLSRLASGALLASAALVPGTLGVVVTKQISQARSKGFLPRPGYVVDTCMEAPWTEGTALRLAFLGDSLVEGVGAPLPSQSLPAQTAYRLTAHLHRPVRMRGYGIASSRTMHVLADQVPRLDRDLDYVIVLIGANDATHGTPPWEFARQIERLIDDIHQRTGAEVVLLGIPDIHSAPLLERPLRDLAGFMGDTLHRVLSRVVDRHPHARQIALRAEVGAIFRKRGCELFASDGYHPNPRGYAIIAEAVARSLTAMILEDEAYAADESTVEDLEAARQAAHGGALHRIDDSAAA